MSMPYKFLSILSFIFLSFITAIAADDVSLPFISPMFGDNMVLQRGKENTIWGCSSAGDVIDVEIAGHSAKAVADANGHWEARIEPPPMGGPYTLKIDGPQHIELTNVLVGDDWLCGGQSNMELPLSRTRNGQQEIKDANYPEIRLYKVQSHAAYSRAAVAQGQWKVCSPQTISENGGFSAVAYFFSL
jgi:sialate O-acetylesterase